MPVTMETKFFEPTSAVRINVPYELEENEYTLEVYLMDELGNISEPVVLDVKVTSLPKPQVHFPQEGGYVSRKPVLVVSCPEPYPFKVKYIIRFVEKEGEKKEEEVGNIENVDVETIPPQSTGDVGGES